MTEETLALDVQKEELPVEETERTRECQCFIPRADIYEVDDNIFVVVDLPGIEEDNIDITLEKNILSINAITDPDPPEGYSLAFSEYEIGDYERKFRISDQVDRDAIEAIYSDVVLRLTLPKAEKAKTRKIAVKARS